MVSSCKLLFARSAIALASIAISSCVVRHPPAVRPAPIPQAEFAKGGLFIVRGGAVVAHPDLHVDQRMFEYPSVTFAPGEFVTVEAGGCVNTQGIGKLQKHFVYPSGPNSDRLYRGRIWIPGVTPGLVPLAGWIGQSLQIPRGLVPADQLFLRLGYDDDEYKDENGTHPNNLDHHDNGTENQCKGVGPAYVVLTLSDTASSKVASRRPMDLDWRGRWDENFLPNHPIWAYKADQNPVRVGDLPKAHLLCNNFTPIKSWKFSLGEPPCTNQAPYFDSPKNVIHNGVCTLGWVAGTRPRNAFKGHVNWFPSTFLGTVTWVDRTTDKDYNLRLRPDSSVDLSESILTDANKNHTDNAIEIEFYSLETVNRFGTNWWKEFRDSTQNEKLQSVKDKRAVVTGLVGVDSEHEAQAELHPVYGLAMKVGTADADETWAIFVRNWGNEGYCSQEVHYLDLPSRTFTLRLPWNSSGSELPTILPATSFLEHGPDTTSPVEPRTQRSRTGDLLVSFRLPPPEAGGIVEGELHLKWQNPLPPSITAGAAPPPPPPPPEGRKTEQKLSGEEALEKIIERLTPAERQEFEHLTQAAQPAGPLTAKGWVQKKLEMDDQRIRALCTVKKGNIPELPGVCAKLGK